LLIAQLLSERKGPWKKINLLFSESSSCFMVLVQVA